MWLTRLKAPTDWITNFSLARMSWPMLFFRSFCCNKCEPVYAWALVMSGLWWVWVCENVWVYVCVCVCVCVTPARLILYKFFLPPGAAQSGSHCQSLICRFTLPISDLEFTTSLIWNSLPFSDLEPAANLDLQFTANLWSKIRYHFLIWNSLPVSNLQFTANLWSAIHCKSLICNLLPISHLQSTANAWYANSLTANIWSAIY